MAPASEDTLADDSDWEYEYDENEIEDFYFTLDLPKSIEPAAKRRKIATEKAKENDTSFQSQYIMKGQTRRQSEAQRPLAPEQQPPEDPLRFTDLHTTTPVIEYQDQRFEGQWTTDLGTQFHVSRPGTIKKPYKSGHAVDVIALSRVRLTARHAMAPSIAEAAGSAERVITLDDDEGDLEDAESGTPSGVGSQPQQTFLERLAAIQRKKAARPGGNANGALAGVGSAAESSPQPTQNAAGLRMANGATPSGNLPDSSLVNAPLSMDAANGLSNTLQRPLPTADNGSTSTSAQQGPSSSGAGVEHNHATEEPT